MSLWYAFYLRYMISSYDLLTNRTKENVDRFIVRIFCRVYLRDFSNIQYKKKTLYFYWNVIFNDVFFILSAIKNTKLHHKRTIKYVKSVDTKANKLYVCMYVLYIQGCTLNLILSYTYIINVDYFNFIGFAKNQLRFILSNSMLKFLHYLLFIRNKIFAR